MREEGTYRDTTYLKNIYAVGMDKFRKVILPNSLYMVWWPGNREGRDKLGKDYMAWLNSHKEGGVNISNAFVIINWLYYQHLTCLSILIDFFNTQHFFYIKYCIFWHKTTPHIFKNSIYNAYERYLGSSTAIISLETFKIRCQI